MRRERCSTAVQPWLCSLYRFGTLTVAQSYIEDIRVLLLLVGSTVATSGHARDLRGEEITFPMPTIQELAAECRLYSHYVHSDRTFHLLPTQTPKAIGRFMGCEIFYR